MTTNQTIEELVNQKFDPISDKITALQHKLNEKIKTNRLTDKNINAILSNVEIQVNKILQIYDKLSKNELTFEEKYQFAQYLINIYNKANRTIDINKSFGVDVKLTNDIIKLLQSSDIHDKVIGIDNFMSLAHTSALLLTDFVAINNNFYLTNYDDITEEEQSAADKFVIWRKKLNASVINKLNYIRNRRELPLFEYPELPLFKCPESLIY